MSKNDNNNFLMGVIFLLLIVIAIWAFFYGKTMWTTNVVAPAQTSTVAAPVIAWETPKITIISDTRCGSTCDTTELVWQLKEIPTLATAEITQLDYSEQAAKDAFKSAGITTLPAAIFSNNSVSELTNFLKPTSDFKYSLELDSTFDPTVERSDRWFMVLDVAELNEFKKDNYIKGNIEAPITWIEYSDLECPFCAKLHSSWTPWELAEKYGDKLNTLFQHFPLDFHKNALPWAQLLECIGEEKWSEAFYTVLEASFKSGNSSLSFLVDEAVKVWWNKEALEKCVSDWTYATKATNQMSAGTSTFGVSGTPGNVLINNTTWEYEVISGAYPTSNFVEIIDRLLK